MLSENGNPLAEFDVDTITAFRVNIHATNKSNEFTSQGSSQPTSQGTGQPTSQPTSQDNKTIEDKIIELCIEPRSLVEIAKYCGFKDTRYFKERYLNPLLGTRLQMTIPDKPTSSNQKYILINEQG